MTGDGHSEDVVARRADRHYASSWIGDLFRCVVRLHAPNQEVLVDAEPAMGPLVLG
jgi:hypothetical protein